MFDRRLVFLLAMLFLPLGSEPASETDGLCTAFALWQTWTGDDQWDLVGAFPQTVFLGRVLLTQQVAVI